LSKKKSRYQIKKTPLKNLPLDIAIGLTGILLIGFIYSFSQKAASNSVRVDVTFPNADKPKMLAKELYQENPIQNIKIEVLNGCGINGIAAEISEFLRTNHRIDVIRSDNAERYNYPNTIIIGRNENLENLRLVSESFGVPIENKNVIRHEPDESLSVDVTVILGKDIHSYSKYFDFSSKNFK